jgi:S1-C subfamily serine protease
MISLKQVLVIGSACRMSTLKSCRSLLTIWLAVLCLPAWGETPDWSETLERISSGVVSLKVDVTRAFDTERNQSSQATGFVIDAEQGLILTNRHVVTPGPVRAKALFLNQEEVALTAIYRDPVHDFGLFRFDPKALRYIKPAELSLKPQLAAVGVEVRIVGNDAGEQLSILSGTIARLNRHTPNYGYGNYNDFNTYYIQAATGSSGGSSGSPVIDSKGNVVALNAGASSSAASSFFLPLDRVKRAADLIRAGKPVTRGTLETQFVQVAFDELRRRGLNEKTEEQFRKLFPDQTGMLVVRNMLREGTAADLLQIGDVLLRVNDISVTNFVPLEAILDDSVGQSVKLTVERNGQILDREITVADLHAITPAEYIQFSDGIFHNLSYQQAWHFNKPLHGVYIAMPGFALRTAGIPRSSVIVEMDGQPIENLDDMEAVLEQLADGEKFSVRLFSLEDPQGSVVRIVQMDRRWFPASRCIRDDQTGQWPCQALAKGPVQVPPDPVSAQYVEQDSRLLQKLAPSLVLVNFDMPYTVSGVGEQHYYGTGLVVDAERGYVVVDRNTVPEALGNVRLTFAGAVEITGKVEFIHPLHNLALLSYDPALVGDTPVRSARLGSVDQKPADKLIAVGLRADSTLVSQEVQVASWDPAYYPLSRSMRFRDTNLETLSLVTSPRSNDGVLADKRGSVVALWSSFAYESGKETRQENNGVPIDLVADMLEIVRTGGALRSLEAELRHMPLSVARNFGLSDAWATQMELHDPERRQLLAVVRTVAGSSSADVLRPGDLLLSIDGVPVTRFREVEKATQKDQVQVVVWRNDGEQTFDIDTMELDGRGVRRVVTWGGALLQAPYREMAAQRGIAKEGVYVAYFAFGTPVSRSGLDAGSRIIEVDGQPVADLDAFIELIRGRQDYESVRLTTVAWNRTVRVVSVTLDEEYWPAWELVYNGDWHRVPIITEPLSPATNSNNSNSDQ